MNTTASMATLSLQRNESILRLKKYLLLIALPISMHLVGCDDSSSGSQLSQDAAGAPLTGRIVGATFFDNTLLGLDLAVGRFNPLPGNTSLASTGALNSRASLAFRRDRSVLSGMVLTVDDCSEEIDETVCFFYLDRDGNVTGQFDISSRFPGPGKLSHDGTHLVVDLSDRVGGNSTMTMYRRDGTFVSNWSQSGAMRSEGSYDWLPDGRLVYSIENRFDEDAERIGFIITEPFSTEPDRTLLFPEYYNDGAVESIETSPDGTQLLVNLQSRTGPTRPILVDTETFSIQQLIDREDGGVTNVDSIVWGPNGQWAYAVIATSELLSGQSLDNSTGGTVAFIGSFDSLYAYSVNGNTHPMPSSLEDFSSDVQLVPTDSSISPGGEIGGGNYRGDFIWVP